MRRADGNVVIFHRRKCFVERCGSKCTNSDQEKQSVKKKPMGIEKKGPIRELGEKIRLCCR